MFGNRAVSDRAIYDFIYLISRSGAPTIPNHDQTLLDRCTALYTWSIVGIAACLRSGQQWSSSSDSHKVCKLLCRGHALEAPRSCSSPPGPLRMGHSVCPPDCDAPRPHGSRAGASVSRPTVPTALPICHHRCVTVTPSRIAKHALHQRQVEALAVNC